LPNIFTDLITALHKAITGMALLQLVLQGRVLLEPVGIRMLLSKEVLDQEPSNQEIMVHPAQQVVELLV
jgi:hypothetical protein